MKALALALAVLVIPAAADAATKNHHRSRHMSQQARGSYAYQPQIACTQFGLSRCQEAAIRKAAAPGVTCHRDSTS